MRRGSQRVLAVLFALLPTLVVPSLASAQESASDVPAVQHIVDEYGSELCFLGRVDGINFWGECFGQPEARLGEHRIIDGKGYCFAGYVNYTRNWTPCTTGRVPEQPALGDLKEIGNGTFCYAGRVNGMDFWGFCDLPGHGVPGYDLIRDPLGHPCENAPASRLSDIANRVEQKAIDCAVHYGVVHGTSEDTFSPDAPVTRGQVASMVTRLLDLTSVTVPAPQDAFTDDDSSVHESSIERLAAAGLVRGVSAHEFGPDRLVTRGQLVSILVRLHERAIENSLWETDSPFTDLAGDVHEVSVEKALTVGLVAKDGTKLFHSTHQLDRAQAAALLARGTGALVIHAEVDVR